jgi:hypothetical protein
MTPLKKWLTPPELITRGDDGGSGAAACGAAHKAAP